LISRYVFKRFQRSFAYRFDCRGLDSPALVFGLRRRAHRSSSSGTSRFAVGSRFRGIFRCIRKQRGLSRLLDDRNRLPSRRRFPTTRWDRVSAAFWNYAVL